MNDWQVPGFKYELCTACKDCVKACPEDALAMVAGRPELRPEVVCTYCGLCENICPTGAVFLTYEIVLGDRGAG